MKRFFIVLITGVGIISAIALYFIFKDFDIDKMTTTERMTFFLQVLAGFVTACISTWGLTIAHRKNKHWEIEKCYEFKEEYDTLGNKRNNSIKQWDEEFYLFIKDKDSVKDRIEIEIEIEKINAKEKMLTNARLNFWEKIARLEKRSYLDSNILYDSFYVSLCHDLESGYFDNHLKESYQENKHIYYHTRTLYIKWKERYNSEKDHKDLTDSWEEMQRLINIAKQENPAITYKRR